MKYRVALIKGDGIGPEVISSAVAVLDKTAERLKFDVVYEECAAGGQAIDLYGDPLPPDTVRTCKRCDAVLLGAVGGFKWDLLPADMRPEKAILGLRSELGLFANIRPIVLYPALAGASPLRGDIAAQPIDFIFVRELTGGIYYSSRGTSEDGKTAFDTEKYTWDEIERIGRTAFDLAMKRKKSVVSIDKANVLDSSRLWRRVMHSVAVEYPEVKYEDILVDNAAMQLIISPGRFDIIVTSNMFGDILSDEAAALTGSIGLIPSASFDGKGYGLYEPIHGSAPDITGKGIANPIAAILSAALMLRHSFDNPQAAEHIESAVGKALQSGARTRDLSGAMSTDDMTAAILSYL